MRELNFDDPRDEPRYQPRRKNGSRKHEAEYGFGASPDYRLAGKVGMALSKAGSRRSIEETICDVL